jgi:hypothetical protein
MGNLRRERCANSWFDKLTTNGKWALATNGKWGLATNGKWGLATNGNGDNRLQPPLALSLSEGVTRNARHEPEMARG